MTDEYFVDISRTLASGGVIVSPTMTNYNLVCNALDAKAVSRVYEIKKRTKPAPLPVNFIDVEHMLKYVDVPSDFNISALGDLWPGEICFIFWQKENSFPDRLSCGLRTVACSNTRHPILSKIQSCVDFPLACTSANLSGMSDGKIVNYDVALSQVGNMVDKIIRDDEFADKEKEGINFAGNTIIDTTFQKLYVCREGAVPLSRISPFFEISSDISEYRKLLMERLR